MIYWMRHKEHGVMPVYELVAVESNKKHGWVIDHNYLDGPKAEITQVAVKKRGWPKGVKRGNRSGRTEAKS